MEIFYTSGLNKKVLSFFVHYINQNFPSVNLKKLHPIHIVKTCLSDNCVFHSEHKLDDAIGNIINTEDKVLLALKEPWLEGQCDLLLNGRAIVLLLKDIQSIDDLVWKLVHAIGHLYGLEKCDKKDCAMSTPDFSAASKEVKPLCQSCSEKLSKSAKNSVIKVN
jgi:hypothetical protein